ncbi:hypothetical protein HK097_007488 [Rhizophlyctis rosea]|uniref:Uncharacterized protein n=1 Tax=Rhizophlyctis rosea TaxID=64517 RepID=A0AAD5SKD5_9FUNG|nr:hypothetical protein HK097_007488 [Rhizophlyctis rosea]
MSYPPSIISAYADGPTTAGQANNPMDAINSQTKILLRLEKANKLKDERRRKIAIIVPVLLICLLVGDWWNNGYDASVFGRAKWSELTTIVLNSYGLVILFAFIFLKWSL